MVSMELNSSKLIILMEGIWRSDRDRPSFFHIRVNGESPRATVQVKVVRSPCCRLEGARKGTTLGATKRIIHSGCK